MKQNFKYKNYKVKFTENYKGFEGYDIIDLEGHSFGHLFDNKKETIKAINDDIKDNKELLKKYN